LLDWHVKTSVFWVNYPSGETQ